MVHPGSSAKPHKYDGKHDRHSNDVKADAYGPGNDKRKGGGKYDWGKPGDDEPETSLDKKDPCYDDEKEEEERKKQEEDKAKK